MERIKKWYEQKTEKMAQMLIEHGIIPKEDRVIYQYGIAQIGYVLLYILTYCTIAFVTRNVWLLLWYLVCFTLLRVSAGGFHLKSRHTCFLVTTGCVFFISLLLKQEVRMLPIWGQNVLFGVSSVAIFFLAPIDTPNRRVDSVEYQVYRKRTIGVLGIEVILYLVLQIINFQQEASAVFIAVFQEMMFLCMGKQEGVFDK